MLGVFRPKRRVSRADLSEQKIQNTWLIFTFESGPNFYAEALLIVKAPSGNAVLLELASVLVLLGPATNLIDALEAAKAKKGTTAAQVIQIDQKIADVRSAMVKAQQDSESELSIRR